MKIRIHDTDFEGNPVECTGEFFTGATAFEIVEAMKQNPFNSHLEPVAFMRQTLSFVGQEKYELPADPAKAAQLFLQRLTVLGFSHYELEDVDLQTTDNDTNGIIEKP